MIIHFMSGGIQLISSIYRGIFWIICHYDEESYPIFEPFDLLAFKVECDENGNIIRSYNSIKCEIRNIF